MLGTPPENLKCNYSLFEVILARVFEPFQDFAQLKEGMCRCKFAMDFGEKGE